MTDSTLDKMELAALTLMAAAEEAGLEVRLLNRPGDVPAVAFRGDLELVADPRHTDCYDLWGPSPHEVLLRLRKPLRGLIVKDREPIRWNLTLNEAVSVIRDAR